MQGKVFLFIGDDLPTHILLNRLVPQMKMLGLDPVFVFSATPQHFKTEMFQEEPYYSAGFYEKHILHEAIYPFLESQAEEEGSQPFLSPNQLAQKYGLEVHEDVFVNRAKFLDQVRSRDDIVGGISIRCYQKFGLDAISTFEDKGFLWNLHPGKLPYYRGVIPALRVMQQGGQELTCTLHKIDEEYDTGDIIDMRSISVDYNKSVLGNYFNLMPVGGEMVVNALSQVAVGSMPDAEEQPDEGGYYGFPRVSTLEHLQAEQDIRLVDRPFLMKDLYLSLFSQPGSSLRDRLQTHLVNTIAEFELSKGNDISLSVPTQSFTPFKLMHK